MQRHVIDDSGESVRKKHLKLLYTNIVSFTVIVLLAFFFGMLVIALGIGLYYTCLFPTFPAASLESPGMYDYANDYREWRVKKDTSRQEEREEAAEDHLEDYYDTARDNEKLRPKRNGTSPSPEVTNSDGKTPTTEGPSTVSSDVMVNVSNFESNISTTSTPTTTEGLDFSFSNRFIDSVFGVAADANLKEPLGLCRNNFNIKAPLFNGTVFPAEDASEILSCINVIVKGMTVTNLCAQMDEEMEAYLRWLVLTGEPKYKPPKTVNNDYFLFPTTCGAGDPGVGDTGVEVNQVKLTAPAIQSKPQVEQVGRTEPPH